MSLLTKSIHAITPNIYSKPILCSVYKYVGISILYNSVRNYAARKGTRERRKKQKVKVEETKVGFIPHNQRDREKFLLNRKPCKFDDSWKKLPPDDVYAMKYYRWKIYDFAEAVKCHRETHHPEIYNHPTANLHLTVELNMSGEKKSRFLDNFTSIVGVPHPFDHGEERPIVVFSKDPEMLVEARNAGADLAGGPELIKEFQTGNISIHDFKFVLAHPNILPELVFLRGIMKKKFPNAKNRTLEADLAGATHRYKTGIQYAALKDEYEKDFGSIQVIIGTLDTDVEHLEENFRSLINDVYSFKPKREGTFITRCLLWSPPTLEKFKIDHNRYIKQDEVKPQQVDEEEVEGQVDDQVQNRVAS